jgi:hypothetical protein
MEKLELIRIVAEGVGVILLAFLGNKTFKYRAVLLEIIKAAKDVKVTETEFQAIVDAIKAEIWPKTEA